MDKTINSGIPNERPGATGIDDPEIAQPSLRDVGGTDSGAGDSVYRPHDEPVEGPVLHLLGPAAPTAINLASDVEGLRRELDTSDGAGVPSQGQPIPGHRSLRVPA